MKSNRNQQGRSGFLIPAVAVLAATVCMANAQENSQNQRNQRSAQDQSYQSTSAESKTFKGQVVLLADYLAQKHLGSENQRPVGSAVPSQGTQPSRQQDRQVSPDRESDRSSTDTDSNRRSSSPSALSTMASAADINQPLALIAEDTGLVAKVTPGKQENIYLLLARNNDRQGMQALQSLYRQVAGTTGMHGQSSSFDPASGSDRSQSDRSQSDRTQGSRSPATVDDAERSSSTQAGAHQGHSKAHSAAKNWQVSGKVVEIGGIKAIFVQSAKADSSTQSGSSHEQKTEDQSENENEPENN